MANKWMQGAVKHPGAFTKKAKSAGESIGKFAKDVLKKGSKASGKTKKQAVLAETFRKIARKRKKKSNVAQDAVRKATS